jgi:hypothetical protein
MAGPGVGRLPGSLGEHARLARPERCDSDVIGAETRKLQRVVDDRLSARKHLRAAKENLWPFGLVLLSIPCGAAILVLLSLQQRTNRKPKA